MKLATKELVEKILLRDANKECFSVISKNRSFALTDDIIMQSLEESENGFCPVIDVYQIINSIWRDTKEGRIFAVFAEARRYVAKKDQDGNYPSYVSKSTPANIGKPKRIMIMNIDTGEMCDVVDEGTIGSKIYDTDPNSTQRRLDILLSKSIDKARDGKRMKYDPEFKALCDEMCVEEEEDDLKIPQRVESQSAADYILGLKNGSIEEKTIPYDCEERQVETIYINKTPDYYIGVSATDDSTPDQGDIKNALNCHNRYFEMYRRLGHKEYDIGDKKVFSELYEGSCYNVVDGVFGQKAIKIKDKCPTILFSYTNTGDFIKLTGKNKTPMSEDREMLEDAMGEPAEKLARYAVSDNPNVHIGELICEIYSLNEKRIPGCQWAEDIKEDRRKQSLLESEYAKEQ